MLNISHNKLHKKVSITAYHSARKVLGKRYYRQFNRFLIFFTITGIIVLFLPWTQHITGQGQVTTLKPDHRPQTIQSPIPGRIEAWFVQEGDFVRKGDTLLRISEVKSDYFDTQLVARTNAQITSKSEALKAYTQKVNALQRQVNALQQERILKFQQAQNKLTQTRLQVVSDSTALEAAQIHLTIAKRQFERTVTLQKEGLKALKDVEAKRLKWQEARAKWNAQDNKLAASKNKVLNAKLELSKLNASYADKIAKAQSNQFTASSAAFDTEAQVAKLENARANYRKRNALLFITAPQDGYVNKALRAGIGETFKEGEQLINLMPSDYELAVATYVTPIDLPLIHIGEKVRVQFDGWPAMVFSGWPNVSYGTYGAKIIAIENFISANGKYRVLLQPDADDHPWPEAIRVGSGAKTIALLNDVPIWYEIWRQFNGFPPNFYTPKKTTAKTSKT